MFIQCSYQLTNLKLIWHLFLLFFNFQVRARLAQFFSKSFCANLYLIFKIETKLTLISDSFFPSAVMTWPAQFLPKCFSNFAPTCIYLLHFETKLTLISSCPEFHSGRPSLDQLDPRVSPIRDGKGEACRAAAGRHSRFRRGSSSRPRDALHFLQSEFFQSIPRKSNFFGFDARTTARALSIPLSGGGE